MLDRQVNGFTRIRLLVSVAGIARHVRLNMMLSTAFDLLLVSNSFPTLMAFTQLSVPSLSHLEIFTQ